jgi:hypothetical protein
MGLVLLMLALAIFGPPHHGAGGRPVDELAASASRTATDISAATC